MSIHLNSRKIQPGMVAATISALLVLVTAAAWIAPVKYLLVGMSGAIFANSTGAGGGVIFIPLFSQFGFNEAQAVSSSFGIQCFGMTAGAITWTRYRNSQIQEGNKHWQSFWLLVSVCGAFSVAGIWTNYGLDLQPLASVHQAFKVFSAVLGVCILITLVSSPVRTATRQVSGIDWLMLIVTAFFGGILTGWLSVAVGEMIAFYLIFRRYDVTVSIAVAVVVTALTVWSVSPVHLAAESAIVWNVVKFAGPGAIIGGVLARYLATFLPPRHLKLFFAIWLLAISLWG